MKHLRKWQQRIGRHFTLHFSEVWKLLRKFISIKDHYDWQMVPRLFNCQPCTVSGGLYIRKEDFHTVSRRLGNFSSFYSLCLYWQSLGHLASSISAMSSVYKRHILIHEMIYFKLSTKLCHYYTVFLPTSDVKGNAFATADWLLACCEAEAFRHIVSVLFAFYPIYLSHVYSVKWEGNYEWWFGNGSGRNLSFRILRYYPWIFWTFHIFSNAALVTIIPFDVLYHTHSEKSG